MNSTVKSHGLHFEFAFNEKMATLGPADLKSIETICQDLIEKSLPICVADKVNLDKEIQEDPAHSLRKLKDVLYPFNVRVVTVGADWNNFKSSTEFSADYSGELCCGTHATNTNQIKDFIITHFGSKGDSTFELDAITGRWAAQVRANDAIVQNYFKEMKELFQQKAKLQPLTSAETNYYSNQIADRSIAIEAIFANKPVSYLVKNHIIEESVRYRPSKNQLMKCLRHYFEEELGLESPHSSNSLRISTLDPKSKIEFKFLAFESVLTHEQILSVLKSLKNTEPLIIVYNNYRKVYIFYARDSAHSAHTNAYFDQVQNKIFETNKNSLLIDAEPNYRIIKCVLSSSNVKAPQQNYFIF